MKESLDFESAFMTVMDREFGCTPERSKNVLKMVNREMVEFNKLESRLIRSIKNVLDKGLVIDEHGGLITGDGSEYFVVYFLNPSGIRGVVPNRFFKASSVDDNKLRKILVSWEDIKFEQCKKCNKRIPALEVHYEHEQKKEIYNLLYCERCSKVFVNEMK